jgi:LPS export ABC transporter protein LptC
LLIFLAGVLSAKEDSSALVNHLRGAKAGGFEYAHYDSQGHLLWRISSGGSLFEQDLSLQLESPVLTLYEASGNSTLRSQQAKINREEQWINLTGNVNVQGFQDVALVAGNVVFDIQKKHLRFNEHFVLKRALMQVEGESGVYDANSGLLIVEGRSHTEVWP